MKDNKTKERFIELRAQGISYEKIATELEVSKQTLINWSKELFIEIGNLRVIQLETLLEKYALTKVNVIQIYGERLKALKEELEKREKNQQFTLSDKELYELVLKYSDKINNGLSDLRFKKEETELPGFGHTTVKEWEA